jgi:hypothetical protein
MIKEREGRRWERKSDGEVQQSLCDFLDPRKLLGDTRDVQESGETAQSILRADRGYLDQGIGRNQQSESRLHLAMATAPEGPQWMSEREEVTSRSAMQARLAEPPVPPITVGTGCLFHHLATPTKCVPTLEDSQKSPSKNFLKRMNPGVSAQRHYPPMAHAETQRNPSVLVQSENSLE